MGISNSGPDRPGSYIVTSDDPDAGKYLVEKVPLRAIARPSADIQKSVEEKAMGAIDMDETSGDFSNAITKILSLIHQPADLHQFFREQKQKHGEAFLQAIYNRFSWRQIDPQSAGLPRLDEADVVFYLVPNSTHLNADLPEMEVVGIRKVGEKPVVRLRRLFPLTKALSSLKK